MLHESKTTIPKIHVYHRTFISQTFEPETNNKSNVLLEILENPVPGCESFPIFEALLGFKPQSDPLFLPVSKEIWLSNLESIKSSLPRFVKQKKESHLFSLYCFILCCHF